MSPNLTNLEIKAMELENTIESLSAELLKQKQELNDLRSHIEICEKKLKIMQEEKSSSFSTNEILDEKPPHY